MKGSVDEEEMMRSYVQKGPVKEVDAFYDEGEKAYIEYENMEQGSFLVIIASKGRWNEKEQDVEYKVKLGDGTWYKGGEWILEKDIRDK